MICNLGDPMSLRHPVHTSSSIERQRGREGERQRGRETERQRQCKRERHTQRYRETERHRGSHSHTPHDTYHMIYTLDHECIAVSTYMFYHTYTPRHTRGTPPSPTLMKDMTPSYVCHDSFISVPRLVHVVHTSS